MSTVPDMIEPIVAYRTWRVENEGRLRSLYADKLSDDWAVWQPGEPYHAVCRRHDAPHRDCSCGVYAVKDLSNVATTSAIWSTLVVGEVALWGRIVEHERGYRAQYARPRRLAVLVPDVSVDDIRNLRGGFHLAQQVAAAYPRLPVACIERLTGLEISQQDLDWLEKQEALQGAATEARVGLYFWERQSWTKRALLRVTGQGRPLGPYPGPFADTRHLLSARRRGPGARPWLEGWTNPISPHN